MSATITKPKSPLSFRLSIQAQAILDQLAAQHGLGRTAYLEYLLRAVAGEQADRAYHRTLVDTAAAYRADESGAA